MGLGLAPNFFRHRDNVSAADPAVSSTFPGVRGIDSRGYETVLANIIFAGTTTSVTVEVLFHDPIADVWIAPDAPITWTKTASTAVSFQSHGRRFFMRVSAIAGGAPLVHIDVAGGPVRNDESD